ncbi:MAG TPA: NAD-dependent epimerase/dehydratase family protein [Accumulibacter sp.]|nr:NAD-dependent epimerase/dehydratase family protein [Accumulibacter sp.]HMW16545.1 NAD-dependent epimerase/dehydratase family protein [Accumulibacter sp.]HMX21351.1 NAD-dependent epimerase/dehydratase family protein [Accumulibacter sp.]HMY06637.1 NAD-dependent epimerase/dehydratase family protein [Accumulibacter sp.]HNC18128.1 NAD-dependent epimerase/dehydratase family protein [Accumulibacter sp.]
MQNLLIVGCGDIAQRLLPRLRRRYRVFALLRDSGQSAFWRENGAVPIVADLDRPASLRRIIGLAQLVVHLAPPPEAKIRPSDSSDPRTRQLLAALARQASLPRRIVYISTSGVYGDCHGESIDETRPPCPSTVRASRRADAERQLRAFGQHGVVVSILRAPGIYAANRLPIERLRQGLPVLRAEEDVFTNHIHADDLANLALAALRHGRANRTYNASDDSQIAMGDYFDLIADRFGLPRPPRLTRQEVQASVSSRQWSFMNESRRLRNHRLKDELRVRLRYPHVRDGIEAAWQETMKRC